MKVGITCISAKHLIALLGCKLCVANIISLLWKRVEGGGGQNGILLFFLSYCYLSENLSDYKTMEEHL